MTDASPEYPSGSPWSMPPEQPVEVPLDIVPQESQPVGTSDDEEVPIVAAEGRGRVTDWRDGKRRPDGFAPMSKVHHMAAPHGADGPEAVRRFEPKATTNPRETEGAERASEPTGEVHAPEPQRSPLSPEDRALLRERHLVPVRFMVASDVPRAVAQAALAGTTDALIASGQERQLVEVRPQEGNQYTDANWYIEGALERQQVQVHGDHGPQVYLEEILDQIGRAEPYEQPHWKVLVTAKDLTAEGLNFAFGATTPNTSSTVQSVRRFMQAVPEGRLQSEMIRRLFRHELGHLLGLPAVDRPHTEEKLGLHCTNICTMRQGVSIGSWAERTVEEVNDNVHFCDDCRIDLAERRPHYLPLPPQ